MTSVLPSCHPSPASLGSGKASRAIPFCSNTFRLLQGNPRAFRGQMGYIIPQVVLGPLWIHFLAGCRQKALKSEMLRRRALWCRTKLPPGFYDTVVSNQEPLVNYSFVHTQLFYEHKLRQDLNQIEIETETDTQSNSQITPHQFHCRDTINNLIISEITFPKSNTNVICFY